jgi:hypothetical protein
MRSVHKDRLVIPLFVAMGSAACTGPVTSALNGPGNGSDGSDAGYDYDNGYGDDSGYGELPWLIPDAMNSAPDALAMADAGPLHAEASAPLPPVTPEAGAPDASLTESGTPDAGAFDAGGLDSSTPNVPPISATPSQGTPTLCADGAAPQAYLWAVDSTLFSFDPSSLETRALGVINCPTTANPWSLNVAASGATYAIYEDGSLYEVDLGTLACQPTAYSVGQLGFYGQTGMTLGAGENANRLYVYGQGSSPALGVSDLSRFILFQLGPITPQPQPLPVDLKSDAYGRLFTLTSNGRFDELDPATGSLLGEDNTGFSGTQGGWALLPDNGQLYFFGGVSGGVSRYDVAAKALFPLGQVNQTIVGASAAPCVSSAVATPPGADAGETVAPFSGGDAWIGTYVCAPGLTNVAVVIESVAGNSVNARFDFAQDATQGSFELVGTFDPVTREATFSPGAWVSQPSGPWSAVGLDGYVDLSGQAFSGNITAAGCGAFSLAR